MIKQQTHIWVTWDVVGYHCYPAAPDEVGFLRQTHRHVFKFKAQVEVFDDDRDIEFFMLQRRLKGLIRTEEVDFGAYSCEMLARDVVDYIVAHYGEQRRVVVECSEDGENGAIVEHHGDQ